jgi:hypothetical protein
MSNSLDEFRTLAVDIDPALSEKDVLVSCLVLMEEEALVLVVLLAEKSLEELPLIADTIVSLNCEVEDDTPFVVIESEVEDAFVVVLSGSVVNSLLTFQLMVVETVPLLSVLEVGVSFLVIVSNGEDVELALVLLAMSVLKSLSELPIISVETGPVRYEVEDSASSAVIVPLVLAIVVEMGSILFEEGALLPS